MKDQLYDNSTRTKSSCMSKGILLQRIHATIHMAVTKVVKVTLLFVSEIPLHGFCCAY